MKHLFLYILILGGGFLTLGDIYFKKWAVENHPVLFIIGLLLYNIGLVCFAFTLKEKNLVVASMILVTSNTVLLILASIFYFQEKL